MKKNSKLLVSIISFCLFIILTICLLFIDRQAVGPNGSIVGLATINKWFSDLVGSNNILYIITDWASILPIALAVCYAVIGVVQWIQRKNLKNVDSSILLLGAFYIGIFLVYLFFEFVVVNRRPVLINGVLEASFPSSTTLLSITFLLLSIYQTDRLIKNNAAKITIKVCSLVYMWFLIIGRVIAGVHWLTDILAAIMLALAIVYLYYYLCDVINDNQIVLNSKLAKKANKAAIKQSKKKSKEQTV